MSATPQNVNHQFLYKCMVPICNNNPKSLLTDPLAKNYLNNIPGKGKSGYDLT